MILPGDPNRAILLRVARAMGALCESVVFVGGCATGLLVTSVRAQPIRPTDDVDMVVHAVTAREYHEMEQQFFVRGFVHDVSLDAPICRWRLQEIVVDLMPSGEGVLGFHNLWYPLSIETASVVALDETVNIRLIAAPVFLATKFEAFKGRGNNDFLLSHDLEDIVTVVDGRAGLLEELNAYPADLRKYLAENFSALLNAPGFLEALPGHLAGDAGSQARLPALIEKFRKLGG